MGKALMVICTPPKKSLKPEGIAGCLMGSKSSLMAGCRPMPWDCNRTRTRRGMGFTLVGGVI